MTMKINVHENKKSEAVADFKVGDFVNYDAEKDGGKLIHEMAFAEVIAVNEDGTLKLQPYDQEDFDEVDGANPQCCIKMDHFAGMTDASTYYMDGKFNVYKGYYEIIVTDKDLGRPYSFAGTIDSLDEVEELWCYYDDVVVFDQDIKDDVMRELFGGSDDESGITFADFSDKVATDESKKSESDTADAEQVFKDMADSLGISDRSVITTDGDRVKFVLKLKLKDLEDYAWEYNPKLKVVKNIASPTADAFDGARKTVNTVEDAVAWLKGGIEELLNMEKEAIDLVGNESKKSEAEGDKDVFTIDLFRIDADGEEERIDDMAASQTYYSDDDAIADAKKIIDGYKDDEGVVFAVVMAGEREKPSGDIVGEPFDIYWASSSDKATTSEYRKKANYAAFDNAMDYYAK